MSYYNTHKEERLLYQKIYNTEQRTQYNTYQRQYFHIRKCDPKYAEQRKIYNKKYSDKKKEKTKEKREVKHLKQLKSKMLRELLKKFNKVLVYTQVEEEEEETIPIIEPFNGFRVDKKGYFVLDW